MSSACRPTGIEGIEENGSGVTTRLFQAGDLRALYAIEEACFEPAVRFSRALMRSLTEDEKCRTWVAEKDGVRVGFAIAGVREPAEYAGLVAAETAYIWTIEVLPAFRRMGAALELLGRVEESAREAGCGAVELHVSEWNVHAMALYVRMGYARVGVEAGFYGRGEDGFRYRKELRG